MNPFEAHPPLALDDVLANVVDGRTKGMPAHEVALGDVPARGLSLADLSFPVMSLRSSALEHNVALTADYCRRAGVSLAPHGKTTMSPQLWDRQLRAGAWGLTAASAQQAQVMRGVGVRRVMIANELVDPGSIRWAAACLEDPDLELWSWVDSPDAVSLLEAGMRGSGVGGAHRVLIELGHPGGRTGARSVADAIEVAASVAASPVLELRGVAGYEGTVCAERRPECLDAVRRYLGDLHALSVAVLLEGFIDERHEMLVTAGGSTFFDLAAEALTQPRPEHAGGVRVVIRPGCTLTHDHGFYAQRSPFAAVDDPAGRFHPALELWAAVSSLPEPGLAIVGFGRRDTSFDQGLPVPISIQGGDGTRRDARGITVDRVVDQHAFCRVDEGADLAVGEVIRFGVSHPCTAFDKWRVMPVLDDDDVVVEAVATYF